MPFVEYCSMSTRFKSVTTSWVSSFLIQNISIKRLDNLLKGFVANKSGSQTHTSVTITTAILSFSSFPLLPFASLHHFVSPCPFINYILILLTHHLFMSLIFLQLYVTSSSYSHAFLNDPMSWIRDVCMLMNWRHLLVHHCIHHWRKWLPFQ